MRNHVEQILERLCRDESCTRLANFIYQLYIANGKWTNENIQSIRNYFDDSIQNEIFPDAVASTPEPDVIISNSNLQEWRDCRICEIVLNNFRKFPLSDPPYGINCCFNGVPYSLVLVGRNGVGKSSLYASLEYVLRGTVGEAYLRNFPEKQFVTHCENVHREEDIKIKLFPNMDFKKHEDFTKQIHLEMDAFFCSEWDIYEAGRLDFSNTIEIRNFFLKNLGFSPLLKLEEDLNKVLEEIISNEEGRVTQEAIVAKKQQLKDTKSKIISYLRKSTGFIQNSSEDLSFIESLTSYDIELKEYLKGNKNIEDIEFSKLVRKIKDSVKKISVRLDLKTSDIADEITCFNKMSLSTSVRVVKSDGIRERRRLTNSTAKIMEKFSRFEQSLSKILDALRQVKENREIEFDIQENLKVIPGLYKQQFSLENDIASLLQLKEKERHEGILKNHLESFLKKLNSLLDIEIQNLLNDNSNEKIMIMTVMDIFSEDEKIHVKLVPKEGKLGVDIKIVFDENNKTVLLSPSKYYNTFRYKLFSMMLRVAVAFSLKKRECINFPLIWDDVFYASDYKSRKEIVKFVSKIKIAHDNIFKRENELQLLCFTHDELIMEAFHELSIKLGEEGIDHIILGRLLHYNDMVNQKALTEGNGKYYNLYYKLFNYDEVEKQL